MKTKKRLIVVLSYVILIMVALISVCPVIYTIMIATKQPVDAFSTSFSVIYTPVFDNFYSLWVERGFTKYLFNTLVVTGCCVLISVPTATLGAYGLIRNGGKFATKLLNSTLLLRMFPQMLLAIPYFIIATNLNLADTKLILVIIVVASNQPFALWLMRGFLITIPPELDEAAKIDGCSPLQIYLKLYIPMGIPIFATLGLLKFVDTWNQYTWPLLVFNDPEMNTVQLALNAFKGENVTEWNYLMAATIVIILPILVLFVCLQRYFVQGIATTGMKD